FVIVLDAFKEILLQNPHVEISIHHPINPACFSDSLPQHTPPYHHRTSPKLDCFFHCPLSKAFPLLYPYPFLSI
ncbi:hypothetical protein M407DRAFT_79060, partial [Tulasnella calospora MUT 4182]